MDAADADHGDSIAVGAGDVEIAQMGFPSLRLVVVS